MNTANLKILTMAEKDTLNECEKIIERGQQTFVEVGLAIAKIRDKKLYRVNHATFEDYCQARWGWSRQHAGRLIEAAQVVKSLPAKCNQLVTNEGTARAVADVPKEHRVEVIKAASEATGGHVTAKAVEKEAEKIQPTPPPPDKAKVIQEAEIIYHDRTEIEREIPAEILPLWQRAEQLAADLLSHTRAIKSAMKSGIEDREKDLVWIDCTNTDVSPIQSVINTLTLSVNPHAVCPTCNGTKTRKNCKLCRGRGYIGRHLWTTCVDADTKKMLAKAKKK